MSPGGDVRGEERGQRASSFRRLSERPFHAETQRGTERKDRFPASARLFRVSAALRETRKPGRNEGGGLQAAGVHGAAAARRVARRAWTPRARKERPPCAT